MLSQSAVRSRIQRPVLQSLCASSRAIRIERQYLATHEFMALGSTAKADITKCVQADTESSAKGSAELLLLVLLSSRVGDGDTGEGY